jgi:hypothetical protein
LPKETAPVPDFKFVPTKVFEQTRYRAARAAILGPLVPHYANKELPACLDAVRVAWRQRVMALSNAKYRPLAPADNVGLQIRYFRNCPPVGVETNDGARPCTRYLVCPWCWGRQAALAAFQHLEGLLYGPGRREPPDGLHLVAYVTRHAWQCNPPAARKAWLGELGVLFGEYGLARRVAAARAARSAERETLAADASYLAHRINFAKEGQRVELERCGLALTRKVPSENKYRARVQAVLRYYGHPVMPEAVRVFALGPPTRKALWQGVRKALSYPRSMLYHDPAQVAAVLNALLTKKLNLTARQGPRSRQTFWESLGLSAPRTCKDEGVPDDD